MEAVDTRGNPKNLDRLYKFDKPAFIHMIFYRDLVFISLLTAILIIYYVITLNPVAFMIMEGFLLAVWLLFTPQLYAITKVFTLAITNGRSSKMMNQSFINALPKKEKASMVFRALPYAALAIWLALFAFALSMWL